MDNENYSHQPDLSTENYTYLTNTSPHIEGRRLLPWIVAVVLGLVLVGGASVFIMLTTPGQKILNTFSPTVERTLAIAAREFSVPQSYEVEVNEGTYITQALLHSSRDITGTFSFDAVRSVPSTTLDMAPMERGFVVTDREVLVQDLFSERYVALSDSYLDDNLAKALLDLVLLSTIAPEELLLYNQYQEYELDEDVNNYFIKVIAPNNPWVVIDKESYELVGIMYSFDNLSLNLTPTNDSVSMPAVTESAFGDVLARESVVIRTETNGRFDDLWHRWEEHYFDCFRCVNKIGDTDGDGIENAGEFVLGSDPNEVTQGGATLYPPVFTNLFAGGDYAKPENGGRTGALVATTSVPTDAKGFTFTYQHPRNGTNNDYLNVYFNDVFMAALGPTEEGVEEKIAIPVLPELIGTTLEVAFIVNSYGRKGSQVQTSEFSFVTGPENQPLTRLLRNQGYKIVYDPGQVVGVIPLELGPDEWMIPEQYAFDSAEVAATTATYNDSRIPAITLTAQNETEPAVIERRVDVSRHTVASICAFTDGDAINGNIELRYLPDGSEEDILLTVFRLSTLAGNGMRTGFTGLDIFQKIDRPGVFSAHVISTGEGPASATFAHYNYIRPEMWDLVSSTYGPPSDPCWDITM